MKIFKEIDINELDKSELIDRLETQRREQTAVVIFGLFAMVFIAFVAVNIGKVNTTSRFNLAGCQIEEVLKVENK